MTQTRTAAAFTPGVKYHKFEIAGLGTAPYTFEGTSRMIYVACPGAPVQPGGCCDYCGTAIMDAFWLKSADGRTFKVGCDCILKTTSDRALIVAVKTARQAHERQLRQAREAKKTAVSVARIAAAEAQLASVADVFHAQPHPMAANGPFFATKTRLDWAEWMLAHAGVSGRLSVAKAIETALQESR